MADESLNPKKQPQPTQLGLSLDKLQAVRLKLAQREAAHRKERLARGLSEKAETGNPEPRVLIHSLPRPELDLNVKPAKPLRESDAQNVRVIQERYGNRALKDWAKPSPPSTRPKNCKTSKSRVHSSWAHLA